MEDVHIIELFWARSETAIGATFSPPHKKFGMLSPPFWGNDNIPNFFVDSHTKRTELRESYHLEDCSVG